MKKILMIFLLSFLSLLTIAETPGEILKKIDKNLAPDSVKYQGKMIIHKDEKEYIKEFDIYGMGEDKSFVKFTSPPRDRGTKYLKIEDNLWMFLPRANRTIKISGHMLRQSMMGSDFSYEDQTERSRLRDIYDPKVLDEDKGQYKLELIKKEGVETSYYRRIIWVDKDTFITKKSNMYARSGKLLKVMTIDETKKIEDIYYPTKMTMEDKVRNDSYTEIMLSNIELDVNIPDDIFTLRYLERKN